MSKLHPFVKWPGGKSSELKVVLPNLPNNFKRFFEPFVGSGAVLFALSNQDSIKSFVINDFSEELCMLYKYVQESNQLFHKSLILLRENWLQLEAVVEAHSNELLNYYCSFKRNGGDEEKLNNSFECFLYQHAADFGGMLLDDENPHIENLRNELLKTIRRKFKRMRQLEMESGSFDETMYIPNIETVFKSAYYTHIRHLYNNQENFSISLERHIAHFYFIREYCYSSMFRFNTSGGFNVPYGGMNYNRKDFTKKIDYLKSMELLQFLKQVEIYNLDFEEFLGDFQMDEYDFIFLDPPYDSEFNEYDRNSFNRKDQTRLRDYLKQTKAKFLLIIKNTDFIDQLYSNQGFYITGFDKRYTVSFMNRNEQDVEHLIITNYKLRGEKA